MADDIAQRITALPLLNTPVPEDVLPIVDDPDGVGKKTKKTGFGKFLKTYNISAAEIAENLSNDDLDFKEDTSHILRYGENTNPGVTPIDPAIQIAINVSGRSAEKVIMPAEILLITSSLTSTASHLVIEGQSGVGWNTGAGTELRTASVINVFDLGSASATDLKGPTLRNFSINDTSGIALGGVLIRNLWHSIFDNVTFNDFIIGFAIHLDATGGAIANTRLANVLGRQNKFGLKITGTLGTVAATRYEDNCYFANNPAISGGIGVEIQDGWVLGGVDTYETGVKLVGDNCRVSGRFEGNNLHCHIAGPTARRNIIIGSHFILGGSVASVQIDNNAGIFNNQIGPNTYSAPIVTIVDNTVAPQNNYINEPQINLIDLRTQAAGSVIHRITNSRNVGAGDNAEFVAESIDGVVAAVLRATSSPREIDIGSATSHDVNLIRNNVTIATLTASGLSAIKNSEVVAATNVITAAETGRTFYLNAAGGFTSTLPVPALGLNYKFIVRTASTTAYIITTNADANILFGTFIDIVGELVYFSAQDTLNFVATTSVVGDFLEVESDGTNWYCTAKSGADGGITVAVT